MAANSAAAPAWWDALSTYDLANGQVTVTRLTSQHNNLPLCQETNETPSGRYPSDRNNLAGSLVMGTPAEAKLRATKSLRAWCLADLPGALLHTKLWRPRVSTGEPQWQLCGTQRSNPSLRPTATLTASSSNLSPHDAIGKANNQSPLCCEVAARNDAWWCALLYTNGLTWHLVWSNKLQERGTKITLTVDMTGKQKTAS